MSRTSKDAPVSRDTDIFHAYTGGQTLEQIAQTYGITRERVRQILEKQGVNRRSTTETVGIRHRRLLEEHRQEIGSVFEKTGSVKATVQHFSGRVPAAAVKSVLADIPQHQRYRRRATRGRVHTEESMLKSLRRADRAGARTIQAYREWRSDVSSAPSVPLLVMRYGSWRAARTAAGLDTVVAGTPPKLFTDADIHSAVSRFVRACKQSGAYPSARAYDNWARVVGGVPMLSTVRTRTNSSWIDLVERHGGAS